MCSGYCVFVCYMYCKYFALVIVFSFNFVIVTLVGTPKDDSQWSLPPAIRDLCNLFPLSVGCGYWFTSNKQTVEEVMGRHFESGFSNSCDFHLGFSHSVLCMHILLVLVEIIPWVSPMQEHAWWGTEAFCQIPMWTHLEADPPALAESSETAAWLPAPWRNLWEIGSSTIELSQPRLPTLRNHVT